MSHFALGLDYGTNSCRAVVLDLESGAPVGDGVFDYPSGELGVLLDDHDPNVARQNPRDYVQGIEHSVRGALAAAGIDGSQVVGIGVDTTGSTPMPVRLLTISRRTNCWWRPSSRPSVPTSASIW